MFYEKQPRHQRGFLCCWTALIPAAASVLGSVLSAKGQSDTNSANAEMAQNQMDFQERMSSTAYQRSMADMKAAGLNPILAYQKGGASTPGGSTATMINPVPDKIGDTLSNSATQALRMGAELDKIKADTRTSESQSELNLAQERKVNAETDLARQGFTTGTLNQNLLGQQHENLVESLREIGARIRNMDSDTDLKEVTKLLRDLDIPSARAAASRATSDEEFYNTPFGRVLRMLGRAGDELNPLKRLVPSARR